MPDEGSVERYDLVADVEAHVSGAHSPVATHPIKRLLDVLLAGFSLLLFLPLLIMVSAAIRMETPGPAIFRQRRTGYRGQVFTILKFRTMTVTEDGGAIRHATRNDHRITQVGALLRK